MRPLVLKAGHDLIPFDDVDVVNIREVEHAVVEIIRKDGRSYIARGTDAIQAVMALKPSALEGRRLRWKRHAWAFHNLVGHPLMQIMAWCGFKHAAIRFHDWTTPTPQECPK